MALQCLLCLWHLAAKSQPELGDAVFLATLRTKTLRRELLEALVEKGAVDPNCMLFDGALPPWLVQQCAILDDDRGCFDNKVTALLACRPAGAAVPQLQGCPLSTSHAADEPTRACIKWSPGAT